MKTSRTNSFRLHRIGNTNSVRKTSQTFYDPNQSFKLAAINSVSRGVKHADISLMTGTNLGKLRVQPLEPNEGFANSAHDNLTQVRKKYDQIKKKTVHLQEKILKYKEQAGKLSTIQSQYQQKIHNAKSKAEELQINLKDKQHLLQDTTMQKKVLLNMESRFNKDKVFYFQKQFDLDKQLSYLKKQLNIFVKQGFQIQENGDRSTKIYQKMANQLQRQRYQRQEHIKNLQNMIQEKYQLVNHNQARQSDLQQIAERAIQDKDLNQKQWRKIYLTNTFVNKMLRDKIEKQMEKFKTVEYAFKEIKTATGVADAKTLITKYLNKQAVYGDYLGKIADNQKTIDFLKNQAEQLIAQTKSLQIQKEVLMSTKIKSQDLHDYIKQLEIYEEKAQNAQKYYNKTVQWLTRQLKKLSIIDKKQHEDIGKEKTIQLFQKYIQTLNAEVDSFDCEKNLFLQKQGEIGQRQTQKITRIMPKRSRKNSAGQQIFDVDEEETNAGNSYEETQVINHQRQQLKLNNQKFMKQLKRKKEQEKKLLIQKKQPKVQKGPKIPQPKKEQD